jgi:hypothetical protein
MAADLVLLLGLNFGLTLLLVAALSVLFWQRHSARHREIQLDADRRYMDLVDQMRDLSPNGHTHLFVPHVHDEYALADHDHPHQHDHVVHTHSLEKVSEHEENGRRVVVKKCADCDTIFRDKAS